ncbi:MAG: hypothetical protein K0R26_2872 [Bacteroidota bacterium]|jgi:signal transduction histidine kinase|nr:hypothetical protein [Bacteroidota bacterium]
MEKPTLKLYLILIAGVICAFLGYSIYRAKNFTTGELVKRSENILQQKEALAENLLKRMSGELSLNVTENLFVKFNSFVNESNQATGIALYVYKKDSLCFWTDNQPAVDLVAYSNEPNVQLMKIRNGWYEYIRYTGSTSHEFTLVALIAIKPEYDFENRYLNNNFSSWLRLPEGSKLRSPVNFRNHAVISKFGPPLFEVYRSDGLYKSKNSIFYSCFFYVLAGLLFLVGLFLWLKRTFRKEPVFILVFTVSCFAIRTWMIWFKIPDAFYFTKLYDAKLFADASSFYFSFLGDVLINSCLIFLVSILVYRSNTMLYLHKKWQRLAIIALSFLFLAAFSLQIRFLIYSLVNNSTISYNINELFNFSIYSLTSLLCIGLLIFSFYLCLERFISFVILWKYISPFILLCITSGVAGVLMAKKGDIEWDYLWPLLFLVMAYALKRFKARYNFINIGLIVLAATFIVSSLFSKFEQVNKQQTYMALSENLTDRQDVIAENEFGKVSESIRSDAQLKNLLSLLPLSNEQIEQSLRQRHLTGYFERYDIVLSLFKNDCTPVFVHLNPMYLNEDYFKQQIEAHGFQTMSDNLYFIDGQKESIRYVAEMEIEDVNKNPEKAFRLYLQMEPKLAVNLGAFPDLLLDKSLENKLESKRISYAVYKSNKLLRTFGEYQYPLFVQPTAFKSGTHDGFEHFVYSPKSGTSIVITDKEFGYWGRFTSNSYLFIFFSLVIFCSVWFNSIVVNRGPKFHSLNNRIQFILVSIVVLSLAGVVIGTVWVVSSQFELKNKKDLVLKSQSVLKELQQNIGQLDALEPAYKDITTIRLKRLSQLFGSDISLFNLRGTLYATSQPAIYDQGLVSKFMNPIAYQSFKKGVHANYIHRENIGSLNYLSAYIPFFSAQDRLLGYINLPYFARQKDLEKELSAYLITLINIYTILFAITTLIALLVSNLLTKPLRIIRQQISEIQFGKYNEALHWKSNDEIGNLVAEYNNMLLKLEQSSELLAQSERESAWREMAKQVAHEIKNPLTPMKLNIQHLQRVVDTHPEEVNDRVKKVSQMLIEQIDTLSHIATEFSNFAKLPNATLEVVNLFDVLQNVTRLFQQNTECEIVLSAPDELLIMADREQCLRIFTNLLKNAEQSIQEGQKGRIEIVANESKGWITVQVRDNGSGIADEVKPKMFTPNFTTKTTGTGLGLAMVKNSVLSFNGTVEFATQLNQGTVFTLKFPSVTKTT